MANIQWNPVHRTIDRNGVVMTAAEEKEVRGRSYSNSLFAVIADKRATKSKSKSK